MFGLFKRKSVEQLLEEKYKKLLSEAYELSKTNRMASDARYAEAENMLKELQTLREKAATQKTRL